MQRLGAAKDRGQGLKCDSHNIIVYLLGSKGVACRLGMKAKHPAFGLHGAEAFFHDPGPQSSGGPELGKPLREDQGGN